MAKTWNIYRYDQPTVARATVHELEYHGSWMEDEYVIVSVRSAEPVDFHYGDHLYYRGTRYDINYDANVIKKARSGSYGEGFTYDSIKLYSIAYRLKDCGFKDVVLNEVYDQANKLVYSSQGKFSFFASSVEDLADRIKANINRFFGSGNTWKVYTPDSSRSSQRNGGAGQWSNYYDTPASYGKTDLNISVEDISCYDALKMAYTEFELSFYLNGQDIVIGGKPITADYDFEYGKGNGLYEIERTSDDSQRIVTKLFAYGSEKNLPLNYYANLHKKAYITGNKIQWQIIEGQTLYSILTGITQTQVSVSAGSIVNVTIGGVTVSASLDFRHGVTGLQPDGTGWSEDYDSPLYLMLNLNTDIKNANAATIFNGYTNGSKIYINNGINLNTWPTVENTASNYPALLSINRLMLPGFPDMSLYTWVVTPVAQGGGGGIAVDASTGKAAWKGYTAYFSKDASDPWIKSVNANTIGVREGTANFDSDEDEIYPSIEGTGYDEVDSAEQIADNGYLEGDPSTFTLTPALVSGSDGGIEWNYSEETVSISMKDGYCVGREFQVKGAEKDGETGKWTLTLERQADSSLGNRYFPYKEGDSEDLYQVKQGDKFVILGIPLPKSFVDLASKKLLEEALKHLATIDHQKYTYIPRIDEIEMQRQDDLASQSQGSIVSVHDTICAGMQMQVTDEDLGIDYSPFIDNITIKENGNNGIPTYDVVLKDEKEMTALERIQSEVRGGTDAVLNALDGVGQGEFLSRINDDTAKGFITFMKGLQVGERFVSGLLGEGGVFRREEDGTTYIEADKLYIRMKAYFDTVEIRDYRHSSGNRIASPAGMKCIRVVWFDASGNPLEQISANLSSAVKFRCFFRARDGENEVRNNFVVGDQAYCHITTVETAQDSTDAKGLNMRHYWRLVIGKSSSPDTNGEHWIDLSNVYNSDINTIGGIKYAGFQADSDVPQEQDDIVQLGNVNDATRRGAIIEFVTGADSPSYQIFQGIGDIAGATSLSTKRTRQFSTSDKNFVNLGYATGASSLHGAGHAFLEVMGDFYFGAKPASGETVGNTYIKYDSDNQQLDIKANVTFTSPTTHQDTTIEDFAGAVTQSIEDLQEQIDGEIDTWFYEGTPTLNNAPANGWTTDTEKERHLGDLYYDIGTGATGGFAYRFIKTESGGTTTYSWQYIDDTAITEALREASLAYDLADHKRRVFLTTPTPPYDNGDLWVNAVWPASGADQGSTYNNDILRCQTSKTASQQFAIADWMLASKYTDDSALVDFVTNTYAQDLANIETQVDAKAETWYQDSDPSLSWNTDDKKAVHVGDIWYDTSANGGKKTYIWRDRGAGQSPRYYWAEQAVPDDVFDEIDGKAAIYVAWNAWVVDGVSHLNVKDLFIPSADVTPTGSSVTYYVNKVYRCTNASTPTFQEIRYTDDSKFDGYINAILNGTGASGDAATVAAAQKAIKDALGGATVVDGGLLLTSLIAMRKYKGTGDKEDVANYDTWAGISGLYQTSETGTGYKGHGIAAWYGGAMVDKECISPTPSESSWNTYKWARSLFRFDGSGYVAGGNLTWDKNGQVTLQGVTVNATTLQKDGSDVATESMLAQYLPLSAGSDKPLTGTLYSQTIVPNSTTNQYDLGSQARFFNNLFIRRIYLYKPNANDTNAVYLEYNSTSGSQGVHLVGAGFYSDSFVSAFGIGTSGGGGTVSLCAPLDNINNYITQLPAPNLDGVTFVWNKATSKFVYSTASGAKLSVNGGITAGAASSINGNLSVTGNITVNGGGFKIDGKTNSDVVLAGGSTIALSEIGGGGSVNSITIGSGGTNYTPDASGIVTLPAYLPLSGGTMTGAIGASTASNAYNTSRGINFGDYAHIGASSSGIGLYSTGTIYIRPNSTLNASGQTNGIVLSSSAFTYNGYTVYHSGNFTPSDYVPTNSTRSIVVGGGNYNFYSPSNTALNLDSVYGRVSNYTSLGASSTNIVDLNTITTTGTYMQNGDGSAAYVNNRPTDTNYSFKLIVEQLAYSNLSYIRQIYQARNSFNKYERRSTDGGTTWTGWAIVQSDLSDYVTTSALNTALSGYVTLAGNETISGAKTFTQDVTVQKSGASATNVIAKNTRGSIRLEVGSTTAANRGVYDPDTSAWLIYTSSAGNTFLPIGNVGIGTTSPSSKLDVDGTFSASGNSTIGGTLGVTGATTISSTLTTTDNITIDRNGTGSTYMQVKNTRGSIRLNVGSTTAANRGVYDPDTSAWLIYTSSTGNTFLPIGNVSIGSTTESFITEKLNVKGNIKADTSDGTFIQIGGARIVWDNTNKALKVIQSDNSTAANLYATGAVSAFGINSSSSGLSLCEPLNNINNNINQNPTVNGATFVWNGNTSKFVYSSASGQRLYADTMYVDSGGLTVGNSGNLTVGGAATVTGAMTVEMGNLVVTSGSAAIGTTVNSSYKLRVNGATFMKELFLSSSTSSSPSNMLHLYYSSGFILSTGSTNITYRNLTVTVGSASPYIDKSWIVTSDMRLKTIVSNAGASIEQIADAPIFNYKTQNGGSDVMLGTSAQYWQPILPCAVKEAPNGYLAQDYPATALAAAVITARKVVDHEQRIRQLEIENEELKKELKQLKAA